MLRQSARNTILMISLMVMLGAAATNRAPLSTVYADTCSHIDQGDGFNTATGPCATTSGGSSNSATGSRSVVGGGSTNTASGGNATVGGGGGNTAQGYVSTIGGGNGNLVMGQLGTIGGGGYTDLDAHTGANRVTDDYGTVGGGGNNQAGNGTTSTTDRTYATVSGGASNAASGSYSSVGGGYGSSASANYTTIAGGRSNVVSTDYGSVGGGYTNQATGLYATVPGGYMNAATSNTAFAAGRQAKAKFAGSFVWGDYQAADIASTAANQFIVRAGGGIWLGTTSSPSIPTGRFINTSTGAYLSSGGTWTNSSDKNLKTNIASIDPQAILQKVASMPVAEWNYKAEGAAVKHIGPMAQDFAAAFGVGEDNKHIATVDADGVALAAIQGLKQEVDDIQAENAALKQNNATLTEQMTTLQRPGVASSRLSLSWSLVVLMLGSLALILLACLALVRMHLTHRQLAN